MRIDGSLTPRIGMPFSSASSQSLSCCVSWIHSDFFSYGYLLTFVQTKRTIIATVELYNFLEYWPCYWIHRTHNGLICTFICTSGSPTTFREIPVSCSTVNSSTKDFKNKCMLGLSRPYHNPQRIIFSFRTLYGNLLMQIWIGHRDKADERHSWIPSTLNWSVISRYKLVINYSFSY